MPGTFRGAEATVERWRPAIALVPDIRIEIPKVIAATEEVGLCANRGTGHLAEGGGR